MRWEIVLLEPVNDERPYAARSSAGLSLTGFTAARSITSRNSGPACRVPARFGCCSYSIPPGEAITLVAGDKAGRWNAWYTEAIPLAEERYAAYQQQASEEEE
jgi:hypothetical protein